VWIDYHNVWILAPLAFAKLVSHTINFFSHSASLLHAANAINYEAIVELAMHVCFFEPQETPPPPRLKIHPLVEA